MRNTPLKLAITIFCFAVSILPQSGLRAQAPNSAKDPYILKPIDLPTAETPAPYGFIAGVREGFGGGTIPLNYNVDAFYDCWSLGYHVTDYGKTFRLGLRSLGREDAPTWFFEYGTGSSSIDSTLNDEDGNDTGKITRKTNYNLLGFGLDYIFGYTGKGTTTGFTLAAAAGTALGSVGGFYIETTISYGVRIPISTMALTLEASLFGNLIDIPSGSDNVTGAGGVAITAKYGFNFNSN